MQIRLHGELELEVRYSLPSASSRLVEADANHIATVFNVRDMNLGPNTCVRVSS